MVRRIFIAMIAACPAFAQNPDLRATVHLVVAPTTVTDRTGQYVNGLADRDFILYDNGVRRDLHVDYTYVPISLVIAVQSSSFSAAALNNTGKIGSMIEPLLTGERGEAAVVAFDSEVRTAQPLTSNFAAVKNAMRSLRPGDEGGRMVDAIAESVRMLASRPAQRRRVILLISETKDRGSREKLEDVVTQAERDNVAIYPVTYSAYATAFTAKSGTVPPPSCCSGINIIAILREVGRMGKKNTAEAFSMMTGGRRYSFTRQRGLEEAISRLGEELHSQYLLSFTVGGPADDRFHTIDVRVPARPDCAVRTRPGYWLAEAR